MKRFSSFFLGMLTGAALLGSAMHFHFVRSSQGLLMVPKVSKGLEDTYVDIRDFNLEDWQQHRALAASIIKSDRSELISGQSMDNFRSNIESIIDGLFGEDDAK